MSVEEQREAKQRVPFELEFIELSNQWLGIKKKRAKPRKKANTKALLAQRHGAANGANKISRAANVKKTKRNMTAATTTAARKTQKKGKKSAAAAPKPKKPSARSSKSGGVVERKTRQEPKENADAEVQKQSPQAAAAAALAENVASPKMRAAQRAEKGNAKMKKNPYSSSDIGDLLRDEEAERLFEQGDSLLVGGQGSRGSAASSSSLSSQQHNSNRFAMSHEELITADSLFRAGHRDYIWQFRPVVSAAGSRPSSPDCTNLNADFARSNNNSIIITTNNRSSSSGGGSGSRPQWQEYDELVSQEIERQYNMWLIRDKSSCYDIVGSSGFVVSGHALEYPPVELFIQRADGTRAVLRISFDGVHRGEMCEGENSPCGQLSDLRRVLRRTLG